MVIVNMGRVLPRLAWGRVADPLAGLCLGPVRVTENGFVFPDRTVLYSWKVHGVSCMNRTLFLIVYGINPEQLMEEQ